MRSWKFNLVVFGCLIALGSCKKEDVVLEKPFTVPETYNFENVDYSGQSERQDQLEEMTSYMKSANTSGVALDIEVLRAMFSNEGENANGNFSFSSSKNLYDKCFPLETEMFDYYFEELVEASTSTSAASNGVAGVMSDGNGEAYLFDENGKEWTQFIEKGLMGAVFYYQAAAVYTSEEKMDVDNSAIEPGEGTEMEHHWDEAYGYLGVTNDFPSDVSDLRFWGKYCNVVDPVISSNEDLSLAFRIGRAAISDGDLGARDEAIGLVRSNWEKVVAATAIHYLNAAQRNLASDPIRNHELSEAVAFIGNLLYNPDRLISESEINSMVESIGDNFYEVNESALEAASNQLAEIYGLESVASSL